MPLHGPSAFGETMRDDRERKMVSAQRALWRFSLAFLLMGFSFTIIQGMMIRELLVSFYGNELSIGLILGNWLVLEAVGSGLIGQLAGRYRATPVSYALLQFVLAAMLPLSLYGAFAVRDIVGVAAGQGVGLGGVFTSSLLILAPLGLVDGAMFAFGAHTFAQLTGREVPGIGQVYVYEAIGGIIGGVIFTFLLIPYLSSLQMALLLASINLLSALSLLPSRSHLFPLTALLLLIMTTVLLSPVGGKVYHWLVAQQWGRYHLVGYGNSVYGNVAVIQQAGQYTFFANGLPVLTAPTPDVQMVEELVHLPLLFHPCPRRVLVVSGGVGGVLHELLKYPLERVDYAELDPLLIRMAQRFPTDLTQSELSDPGVHIHAVDGRLLLRQMAISHPASAEQEAAYDAIFVNLPYPSTLQLNRLYTVECFRLARSILGPEGILVLTAPGSLTHMGVGMRELNALMDRTLRTVFPAVVVVPGDVHLWIASPSPEITALTQKELVARWAERGLPTQMMSEFHIRLKLDVRRMAWFWDSLGHSTGHEVNSDLHPAGLLRGLAYWNALFSPSLVGVFSLLTRLSLRQLLAPLGMLVGLLLLLGWPTRRRTVVPLSIIVTGFSGMAFDLVVVFAFQTLYGYVYQQIGLLITAFMAGLAWGGLLMTGRSASDPGPGQMWRIWRWLTGIELAIFLYWVGLPLLLALLYAHPASGLLHPTLLALNALAGFLVGSEFPLANRIISQLRGGLEGASGLLYACDLVGAFAGSMLVSVVLIPALGIPQTCLLVAALKLISLIGVAVGGIGAKV